MKLRAENHNEFDFAAAETKADVPVTQPRGRNVVQTRMVNTGTTGCLSFGPMAQCVVHALKGLA